MAYYIAYENQSKDGQSVRIPCDTWLWVFTRWRSVNFHMLSVTIRGVSPGLTNLILCMGSDLTDYWNFFVRPLTILSLSQFLQFSKFPFWNCCDLKQFGDWSLCDRSSVQQPPPCWWAHQNSPGPTDLNNPLPPPPFSLNYREIGGAPTAILGSKTQIMFVWLVG